MKAELEIPFKSAKSAEDARKVLEAERMERDRSSAEFSARNGTLRISVKAKDLASLRASLGTYLRLLAAINAGIETEG